MSSPDIWVLVTACGRLCLRTVLGSGTTLIAAQTSGRSCFAIEIDPLYVDVAIRRWQAFTGELATLRADGCTFDAFAAERSNAPKAGTSS